MRLIDADALLENFHKKRNPQEGADSTDHRHRYMQFLGDCEAIRNAPTIDAVPVIRCKDCKHCNREIAVGEWEGSCRYWNTHSVMLNDFCSRAERKED